MRVLLDTNIWLRFFLEDVPEQFEEVVNLFALIDRGAVVPYVSAITMLEIFYIFKKVYKQPNSEISIIFERILEFRGITLLEKTNFIRAFEWHQEYKVKLADCLIAGQLPERTTFVTFDREFRKIKGLIVASPREIIEKF